MHLKFAEEIATYVDSEGIRHLLRGMAIPYTSPRPRLVLPLKGQPTETPADPNSGLQRPHLPAYYRLRPPELRETI